MLKRLFLLSSALALAGGLYLFANAGQPPARDAQPTTTERDGVKIITDLSYVTDGHPRQRLDLYLPTKGAAPCPLLAWIHGGGWTGGSKAGAEHKALLAAGFAVASIEYRFSQDAIYPAQIEDCKAAIRYLRAHAAEYGLDPARIGVWGASAGGHLVALLGTTGKMRDFDVGENLDQSSAVQCVIDWFGPSDFLHWGSNDAALARPDSLVAKLLGGPVPEKTTLAHRASPVDFVTADAAPFLIMHGNQDPLVPLQQSEELDAALKKAGVPSELITIVGGKHGGPGFTAPEQLAKMAGFIGKYLKEMKAE